MDRPSGFGQRSGPVRAPVYVVVDCSSSMGPRKGQPLHESPWGQVQLGFQSMITEFEDSPILNDLAFVSVISFASEAHRHAGPALAKDGIALAPLPDPCGLTDFRLMLRCVRESIESDLRALMAEDCDIKVPIVFVLTDGVPQSDYDSIQSDSEWVPELRKLHDISVVRPSGPRRCHVVAFGIGEAAPRVLCMLKSERAEAFLVTGDPVEATRKTMSAILRSVSSSTERGDLVIKAPSGTQSLKCP